MVDTAPPLQLNNRTWRHAARSARFWLIPAFVALVVLAPLMRKGLPVTRLGLLPAHEGVAGALGAAVSYVILPFGLYSAPYKVSLALMTLAYALLLGLLASRLWRAHGWWVAALSLTVPPVVSLIYQWGNPAYLLAWGSLILFLLLLATTARGGGLLRFAPPLLGGLLAISSVLTLARSDSVTLAPFQLLLSAFPDPAQWYEWVRAPSFQIGFVPLVLGALTLAAALPKRDEPPARYALALLALAVLFIALTLMPGPALLWLIAGITTLLLAAGALPVLDERYARLPVQVSIVAVALLALYPALQPAWFDDFRGDSTPNVFGGELLWLARVETTTADERIIVEAWWQALQPVPRDYSVFVHIIDAQGEVIAQADALLVDADGRGTSRWLRGYVVHQRYETTVNGAASAVRLGIYDVSTLERLPVYQAPVAPDPGGRSDFVRTEEQFVTLPLAP